MEFTKSFITSVILGKDMIPRLGMYQMEKLQFDILDALKNTQKSKVIILHNKQTYIFKKKALELNKF